MKISIESILQPFSLGQISDAIVLIKAMSENGYSVNALERYLSGKVQEAKDQTKTRDMEEAAYFADLATKSPKCPECGRAMVLYAVNTSPGNMVGGGIGSLWQCPDFKGCGFEKENEDGYHQELIKLDLRRPPATLHDPSPALPARRRRRMGLSRAQRAQAMNNPCQEGK